MIEIIMFGIISLGIGCIIGYLIGAIGYVVAIIIHYMFKR